MNLPPNTRELSEGAFSDEELSALALSADASAPLSKDATPWLGESAEASGVLPAWYMPPAMARTSNSLAKVMIVAVVVGFLVIDAFGLCITSGFLSLP